MYSGLTEDLKRVDENMLNACGAYYCLAERRRFGYRRLQVLLVREGEATTSGYTGCMWRRSWAFAVSEDAAGPRRSATGVTAAARAGPGAGRGSVFS
jgi:hypothetical protein